MNTKQNETIMALSKNFEKWWDSFTPLFYFDSENLILYDTGTNKTLVCSEAEGVLLDILQKEGKKACIDYLGRNQQFLGAAQSIQQMVESHGILKLDPSKIIFEFDGIKQIDHNILHQQNSITLEITESCNLRCHYCIYNSHSEEMRAHGMGRMNLETATAAIDLLYANSKTSDPVSIGFYGGEPLLAFDLIHEIVRYAESRFESPQFIMTTNATLLNSDIIDFLVSHEFRLLISIDGPKNIHDEHRVDIRGKGSFDTAIKNLHLLYEEYRIKKMLKYIAINMVISPPYTLDRFREFVSLWQEYPWLNEINASSSYVDFQYNPKNIHFTKHDRVDYYDLFEEDYWQNNGSETPIRPLSVKTIINRYGKLFKRLITDNPVERNHPNGCCVPGVRKLYVRCNGSIQVCDKMPSKAPIIGNVFSGIDTDKITALYINKYIDHINQTCNTCWANRLCSLCYIQGFGCGEWEISKREEICKLEREKNARWIRSYNLRLLKDNTAFDFLNDIHFK